MKREEFARRVKELGFEAIGQRLFRMRTSRELTIRDVADKGEVSKMTVLRVEQGKPIQLDSLRLIAYGVGIKLTDLLAPEFEIGNPRSFHLHKDDLYFDLHHFTTINESQALPLDHSAWPKDVLGFCLMQSRDEEGRFNPNIMYVNQPTKTRSHRGEEFAYVLEGRMKIVFDDAEYVLEAGESVYFWAAEKHRYEPVEAGEVAKVLSIVLDPVPTALSLDAWEERRRKMKAE